MNEERYPITVHKLQKKKVQHKHLQYLASVIFNSYNMPNGRVKEDKQLFDKYISYKVIICNGNFY